MKKNIKEEILHFFANIKNTKTLIIIFIIGIVLIMLPSNKDENTTEQGGDICTHSQFKKELEKELTEIISHINGVGKVDVMVTLSDEGYTYFATDESVNYSGKEKETTKSVDTVHVFQNEKDQGETPLITRKTTPQISGVLVCADGADNPQIKENIIKAVQALLGVKSHRIEVLQRK